VVLQQRIHCSDIITIKMSLAHLCKAASRVAGRNALAKGHQQALFSLPLTRSFATTYKDIPHMVSFEPDMDPSTVKVNILKDEIRQEMYLKYMEDQEKYSFENLSVEYGTSLIRTKAVVYLMQKRHELITQAEADLYAMLEEEPPKNENSSGISKFKLTPKLNPPPVLASLFAKHREDKTVPLSVLISAYNETNATDEKPPLMLSEEKLKEAFRLLAHHGSRARNVQEKAEEEREDIEEAKFAGVDVRFSEASSPYRTSKAFNATHFASEHRSKSFEDNYYPPLHGDSAAKRHEFNLLARVEHETKAQLQHDMEYYERTYAVKTPEEALAEVRTTPLPSALKFHEPPSSDKPISRWKIAFQDLSQSAVPRTKTTVRVPDRTVIRTRKGE